MDGLIVTFWVLFALASLQAIVMIVHACEHRRYHRKRLSAPLRTEVNQRVTLIVPVKGRDPNFERNLQAFFEQQYPLLQLCFVLEHAAEPAVPILANLQKQFPHVACSLVFAGTASACGQKVHNLIQATRHTLANSDILAFADADGCPHPQWLLRLVDRLQSGKHSVVTGYRWMVPTRPTMTNHLLAALNNHITSLTSSHGFNLVWGGAWAIRTDVFRKLNLAAAWAGSLNDDLAVTRVARQHGVRVTYEPHGLVASPVDFSVCQAAEFLRRQFLQVRVYCPAWWWAAAATGWISVGAILLGPAAAMALRLQDQTAYWPIVAIISLYVVNAVRAAVCASAVRPFVQAVTDDFRVTRRLSVLAWPAIVLLNSLAILSSAIGRRLVWRGVVYHLLGPQSTVIVGRLPATVSGGAVVCREPFVIQPAGLPAIRNFTKSIGSSRT